MSIPNTIPRVFKLEEGFTRDITNKPIIINVL
jgi:hypothetical protein